MSSWHDFYRIQAGLHHLSSDTAEIESERPDQPEKSDLLYLKIDYVKHRIGLHSRASFKSGDPVTKYEGFVIPIWEYDILQESVGRTTRFVEIIPGKWYLDGTRNVDGSLIDPIIWSDLDYYKNFLEERMNYMGCGGFARESNDEEEANTEIILVHSPLLSRLENGPSYLIGANSFAYLQVRPGKKIGPGEEIVVFKSQ